MNESDHISVAWLERKVLDALDSTEARMDDVQGKLADIQRKLEAIFLAYDRNMAIIQAGLDKTNELVGAVNRISEGISLIARTLVRMGDTLSAPAPSNGDRRDD